MIIIYDFDIYYLQFAQGHCNSLPEAGRRPKEDNLFVQLYLADRLVVVLFFPGATFVPHFAPGYQYFAPMGL